MKWNPMISGGIKQLIEICGNFDDFDGYSLTMHCLGWCHNV